LADEAGARALRRALTPDAVLDLCLQAGLLDAEHARGVRPLTERRQRMMERERRQQAGDEAPAVSAVEVVASFQLLTPQGQALSEERIQQAVAAAAGLRWLRIDPLKIDAKFVTQQIAYAYARRNCALPLGVEGDRLVLAVDDPAADDVRATMQARAGRPVELVIGNRTDILRHLHEVFQFRATIRASAAELSEHGTDLGNLEQLVTLGRAGTTLEGDERPVVQAVDFLLRYALEQRASDIHVEPKRDHSLVRLRIDGVLHTVHTLPRVVHHAVTSRIKALARLDIAEKRKPQDGRIKLAQGGDGGEVELRISTLPTAFGEKVVLRIFDPQVLVQDLGQLGLFPNELEWLRKAIQRPHGMLLVCGPTGSGKTTTLYSALREVAKPTVNVTTIEDPIEMVVEQFNQTAVNPRIDLTFANALRTILRQDPDVIMVGEIRDPETAQNAVQAAMTGHLVLSTVHTNDAAGTIARLIELGVPPYLVASTLVGVVAQRLVRTICLNCRGETELSPEQLATLGVEHTPGERYPVWQGVGCSKCRDTGLKGRMGVYEVMPVTERIRQQILGRADSVAISRQAAADGMLTLREAAIRKMALGLTSFAEVVRVTIEAD
jgi:general secretion pathway protein E